MEKIFLTVVRAESAGIVDGYRFTLGEPLPNPVKRVSEILHDEGIGPEPHSLPLQTIEDLSHGLAIVARTYPFAPVAAIAYTKGVVVGILDNIPPPQRRKWFNST